MHTCVLPFFYRSSIIFMYLSLLVTCVLNGHLNEFMLCYLLVLVPLLSKM